MTRLSSATESTRAPEDERSSGPADSAGPGDEPNRPGAPARGGDPGLAATLRSFADLTYRDSFWPSRRYEDGCDRLALRSLLPPMGLRLIEVGAGFGRLANEYAGYIEVVLLDASEALLDAARLQTNGDSRVSVVLGDAYQLPFPDASFDAAVCIRVLHHFEDPRPAIYELARVLRPGGVLVIESANKRNMKAVIAYLMRRQSWSPFARGSRRYEGVRLIPGFTRPARVRDPAERVSVTDSAPRWSVATSYLHAPRDLRAWLESAGLQISASRSVGLFRLPFLTGHLPLAVLIAAERLQQSALSRLSLGPSLYYRAVRTSHRVGRSGDAGDREEERGVVGRGPYDESTPPRPFSATDEQVLLASQDPSVRR